MRSICQFRQIHSSGQFNICFLVLCAVYEMCIFIYIHTYYICLSQVLVLNSLYLSSDKNHSLKRPYSFVWQIFVAFLPRDNDVRKSFLLIKVKL